MVRRRHDDQAAKQKILGQVRDNSTTSSPIAKPDQPFCYLVRAHTHASPLPKGSGKALWGIEPDSVQGKLPEFMPDVPEVRDDYTDYMGEIQAWTLASA